MNKILISFFFLFCCLSLSYGQTFYISSTEGANDNDGLSELTPKNDLRSVPKKGVTILLKRGDVFWGGISGYEDCTISYYGKGDRPVICGFKVLWNVDAWEAVGNNLWRLDLSNNDNFKGNIRLHYDAGNNNIGFIYDADKDKLYGRNVVGIDSLKNEMDFYTSPYYKSEDVKNNPFKYVIVKSKGSPAKYGKLCFPMFQSGAQKMKNCKIKGLSFIGFSRMGMYDLNECEVDDCQIDLIGGGIQIGYRTRTRFGNGIELWYSCNNNIIKNCLISRTYDCATTIQANGIIKYNPHNNLFIGNRIYKCRQAFEHFMNSSDGAEIKYEDCAFSNNICLFMGDNEFNSPEKRDCNILSYENKEKSLMINDNVFFGANHLDGNDIGEGMRGNRVYLYEDQYLYICHWQPAKKTIMANKRESITDYKALISDNSKIVVLKRGSWKAKRIERKYRKKVNWRPVDLHLERL